MAALEVTASDGLRFKANFSMPSGTGRAGVVVMHHIFGVNAEIRGITDSLAQDGYLAVSPDLYWRVQPGQELDPRVDFERAIKLERALDYAQVIDDLNAIVDALRAHPACNGRVASLGYCLGGCLAVLMAARGRTDCDVGYFPVRAEEYLDDAAKVKKPLLMHFPEMDDHVAPEARQAVKAALQGRAEIYSYADANHGFTREGGKYYHAVAAKLAAERTSAFLKRNLLP